MVGLWERRLAGSKLNRNGSSLDSGLLRYFYRLFSQMAWNIPSGAACVSFSYLFESMAAVSESFSVWCWYWLGWKFSICRSVKTPKSFGSLVDKYWPQSTNYHQLKTNSLLSTTRQNSHILSFSTVFLPNVYPSEYYSSSTSLTQTYLSQSPRVRIPLATAHS